MRATVIAVYSGASISAEDWLFLGGFIAETWFDSFPVGEAPLGLKGWQAGAAVGILGF